MDKQPMLFALGRRVFTKSGCIASVRYPVVNGPGQGQLLSDCLIEFFGIKTEGVQTVEITKENLAVIAASLARADQVDKEDSANFDAFIKATERASAGDTGFVLTFIFDDVAPQNVEDATLKLYGLSNRFFKPNQLNLAGIFNVLPNVAWQNDQPMDVNEVDEALIGAAFGGVSYAPTMVDKFPLYIHRVNALRLGVRITDEHKVRLGAYLGKGTTLMPGASYVNFNAGTEGPAMVEGRISSAAFVGAGSDIGGGASILGTLSGGNSVPISVGRNCLLEVNSTLGIPIGDAVIIAANTAVLSSSKVRVAVKGHGQAGHTVKAAELAGINAVTFRRNDVDGELEVVRTCRNEEFAKKLHDGGTILSAGLHHGVCA